MRALALLASTQISFWLASWLLPTHAEPSAVFALTLVFVGAGLVELYRTEL